MASQAADLIVQNSYEVDDPNLSDLSLSPHYHVWLRGVAREKRGNEIISLFTQFVSLFPRVNCPQSTVVFAGEKKVNWGAKKNIFADKVTHFDFIAFCFHPFLLPAEWVRLNERQSFEDEITGQ